MYYDEYEDERPRWWKPVGAGLVIALVVGLVFWQLNRSSGSDDAATAPSTPTVTPSTSNEVADTTSSTTRTDLRRPRRRRRRRKRAHDSSDAELRSDDDDSRQRMPHSTR